MTINSPDTFPSDDSQEEARTEAKNKKDDGGIPTGDNGVGLGATNEPNTFEPEEVPGPADT
jgi:hypothetical protein